MFSELPSHSYSERKGWNWVGRGGKEEARRDEQREEEKGCSHASN